MSPQYQVEAGRNITYEGQQRAAVVADPMVMYTSDIPPKVLVIVWAVYQPDGHETAGLSTKSQSVSLLDTDRQTVVQVPIRGGGSRARVTSGIQVKFAAPILSKI